MNLFDLTHSSIEGKFLLEASAGTGKTFAIEQIVCRLIKEKNIPLESILIVTFTRAAALDLKERIGKRLQREGIGKVIDKASIYTIHSFVIQSLQIKEKDFNGKAFWKEAFFDLLESIEPYQEFGPLQLKRHLWAGLDALFSDLYSLQKRSPFIRFKEGYSSFLTLLDQLDRRELEVKLPQWKGLFDRSHNLKQEHQTALEILKYPTEKGFDRLLLKKNLIQFLTPDQLKKDQVDFMNPSLLSLQQLFDQLTERQAVVSGLHCLLHQRKDLPLTFDSLIEKMVDRLGDDDFCQALSQKYQALIIDEFQDTDPTQWKILSHLFLDRPHVKTIALVGDPKQSIYSFRSANPHLFSEVKSDIGDLRKEQLSTCYRSRPELVEALNLLFSKKRDWLGSLDYDVVTAGRKKEKEQKTPSLQIVSFPIKNLSKIQDERWVFSWIAYLIQNSSFPRESIAILVKDRYQAERLERFFSLQSIPSTTLSPIPLAQRSSFQRLKAYVKALFFGSQEQFRRFLFLRDGPEKKEDAHEAKEMAAFRQKLIENRQQRIATLFREADALELIPLFFDSPPTSNEELLYRIEKLELLNEADVTPSPVGVRILTIHASKGLEFELVIPLALATLEKAEGEEGMRLLYVACTRAKEKLCIPFFTQGKSLVNQFLQKIETQLEELSHSSIEIVEAEADYPLLRDPKNKKSLFRYPKEGSFYLKNQKPSLDDFILDLLEEAIRREIPKDHLFSFLSSKALFFPSSVSHEEIARKVLWALCSPVFEEKSILSLPRDHLFIRMAIYDERGKSLDTMDLVYIDSHLLVAFQIRWSSAALEEKLKRYRQYLKREAKGRAIAFCSILLEEKEILLE